MYIAILEQIRADLSTLEQNQHELSRTNAIKYALTLIDQGLANPEQFPKRIRVSNAGSHMSWDYRLYYVSDRGENFSWTIPKTEAGLEQSIALVRKGQNFLDNDQKGTLYLPGNVIVCVENQASREGLSILIRHLKLLANAVGSCLDKESVFEL